MAEIIRKGIKTDKNTYARFEPPAPDGTHLGGVSLAQIDLWNSGGSSICFTIKEDDVTVTTTNEAGVAPYSASYKYTNFEISKDSGIKWIEGGVYNFVVNTKLVVASGNRNIRIRIGGESDGDTWHPVMGYSTDILAGHTYFAKNMTCLFQYKSTQLSGGALHLMYDANTTYGNLVNSVTASSTSAPLVIDSNGYGARYSLIFPTTPLSKEVEKWSSLVSSSGTGASKSINTNITKFYIDRPPLYVYSANIVAGASPVNPVYLGYTGLDLRYTANTSTTYMTIGKRAFLWLKNYDEKDMTFEADAAAGAIVTVDKLSVKFPDTQTDDVYLYFLGWTGAYWYTLDFNYTQSDRIYKYTPSSGELVLMKPKGTGGGVEGYKVTFLASNWILSDGVYGQVIQMPGVTTESNFILYTDKGKVVATAEDLLEYNTAFNIINNGFGYVGDGMIIVLIWEDPPTIDCPVILVKV